MPDIHDVGLMEDRDTLRISSQHLANWLLHGVIDEQTVDAALTKMAGLVDAQNAGTSGYQPMFVEGQPSLAYQAAMCLIFQGIEQPSGYTEPLLHWFRLKVKSGLD